MENFENNNTQIDESGANPEPETGKTYTQEEVDGLLQSEVDRRITSALKKQQAKFEEKMREGEKLAKMNEAEKYKYELEQREQAIIAKEKELAMLENKNEASKILAEKGIALSLVDFVVAEDADTMHDNITLLERAFKQSVKAEVEKRLAGQSAPKGNDNVDPHTMTKEQFRKLSINEQQRIAREDIDLYRAMTTY